MPVNEVVDGICNLFELGNSSQGQHLSHGVDGSWSVLNDTQWVGKQRQSVVPLNFHLQNYGVQQLDSLRGGGESLSVRYKPDYAELTLKPDNSRSQTRNYLLNANGSLLGNQDFQTMQNQPRAFDEKTGYDQPTLTLRSLSTLKSQQEYESGTDSPTLTANSERSEVTEVSTDFHSLRGQQQLVRGHLPISHPGLMQQSGFSDMQLLQQHMMLKQLQEFQRQQQLQQLGDVRQPNSINQLSSMSKQSGVQFSPLNGTPINDASQMFMNWVHCTAPTAGQVSNRIMLSPENGQPMRSMGHVPQQLDVSLYGTPVATARGNMSQYPQVQGIPQAQKHVVQPSGFVNSYLRDQFVVSPDQVSMSQGAFLSSQGFSGKNMFGDVPNQGLNSGILSGNLQEGNPLQTNASMKEFSGRQELSSWSAVQQKSTQLGPQGLVPLDPMEEKILYNMDDNSWDVPFGRRPDMGTIGFGNMLENTDLANSLPSIQSGSWSALMQSAVAEASSSDTGLQEEWSGLTFQNTEHSTDNQLSNLMESDNQQTGWVDNNLQSASSFSSKPLHRITDSSMSSSFPGFQQPGIQFPVQQTEVLRHEGSHESMEKHPKVTGEWVDCNPSQKPSIEGSRQVQSFIHSSNAWAGQILEHTETELHKLRTTSHREDSQTKFSHVPYTILAHQAISEIPESNQSEYNGHADIYVNNSEKETSGKSPQQIDNGSHVYNNSYVGDGETYEKQKNYCQSENSNGSYNSKELSGSEQGYSGQFQFFGHASSNSLNLEQGRIQHFRGNSRASEEVPSKGDLTSVGSDSSNLAAQASQNMLELLHKVDQARDDGGVAPLAKVPEAETGKTGVQLFSQPSTSQGFGLRLGPPSQRLPNSSHYLSSHGLPQTVTRPTSRQVNPELREKNQPSSVQTSPLAHELSQRALWDDKSNASVQIGTSAYSNMQGNSSAAFSHGPTYMRNQPRVQFRSGMPAASRSSQPTLPSTGSRYPHFSPPQDASRQMGTNHLGQQFPVLEALPVSQPSVMPGMSAKPHNVWTDVPIQRQSSVLEPLKVSSNSPSSTDPSNNSPRGGYGSSAFGSGSQQQISSDILDASKHGSKASSKYISDANALPSGPSVAHPHQQDHDGVRNEDNHPHAATRNLASGGHSVDSSSNLHQNYTLLDQVLVMKNVETDPSKSNFGVPHDLFSSRDSKTMSFLAEKTDDPRARVLQRPALQDQPSNEMVKFGQNNSQSQSGSSNVVSDLTEHGQVNPQIVPSWLQQLGTLRNGQMLPLCDGGLAKVDMGQFSLVKPSQNLQIHSSVERVDAANASQGGSVIPSAVASLVGSEHILAPYVLPSEITNQSMAIIRPNKRKSMTSELLPLHKEVTQRSLRPQNLSMAEQDWARATNRMMEKVEDVVEMTEDVPPMLRSKRRLILTTQLMQQLLSPAPKLILSADATSHHDGVIYFISRLALGDACSLTCHTQKDLLLPRDNSSMASENLKTIDRTGDQQVLKFIAELSARTEKLENDFERVDKTASIVDVRVECQELERFAVINRFAKFHIRGQADTSGTPKPFPQRYVTAHPMPKKLPEGFQCISL